MVAIKAVIRGKLTAKLSENLDTEIAILKKITHRNIVALQDFKVRPHTPAFSPLRASAARSS